MKNESGTCHIKNPQYYEGFKFYQGNAWKTLLSTSLAFLEKKNLLNCSLFLLTSASTI